MFPWGKDTKKNEVIYRHPILRYLHTNMNKISHVTQVKSTIFGCSKSNGSAYENDATNCNWLQKVKNILFFMIYHIIM